MLNRDKDQSVGIHLRTESNLHVHSVALRMIREAINTLETKEANLSLIIKFSAEIATASKTFN